MKSLVLSCELVNSSVAVGCALEFEDIICKDVGARKISKADQSSLQSFQDEIDRLFVVCINFQDFARLCALAGKIFERAKSIAVYIFDPFFASAINRIAGVSMKRAALRFHPTYKHWFRFRCRNIRIFVPTRTLIEEFSTLFDLDFRYLPIGVDTARAHSERPRFIDINAYGRQPPDVLDSVRELSGDDQFIYWTKHTVLGECRDVVGQRYVFWRLLGSSNVAMAYDHSRYNPLKREFAPIVGQRWFESLAAGCVIAGVAPNAEECAELFGWKDALVELQGSPLDHAKAIVALSRDRDRLAEIRRENMGNIWQHDWRQRLNVMLSDDHRQVGTLVCA